MLLRRSHARSHWANLKHAQVQALALVASLGKNAEPTPGTVTATGVVRPHTIETLAMRGLVRMESPDELTTRVTLTREGFEIVDHLRRMKALLPPQQNTRRRRR